MRDAEDEAALLVNALEQINPALLVDDSLCLLRTKCERRIERSLRIVRDRKKEDERRLSPANQREHLRKAAKVLRSMETDVLGSPEIAGWLDQEDPPFSLAEIRRHREFFEGLARMMHVSRESGPPRKPREGSGRRGGV
jgi:hypothetical protein